MSLFIINTVILEKGKLILYLGELNSHSRFVNVFKLDNAKSIILVIIKLVGHNFFVN